MASSFRQRLVFDTGRGEIRDEGRRYMLMRPEALMGIFSRLDEAGRKDALAAFAASVVEMGGDSARAYKAHGGGDPDALLATVTATAPELGWGTWSAERTASGVAITVRNSPFAAGYGRSQTPVCSAIAGMATAVGRLVIGDDEVAAREVACAACGAPACRFEIG